MCFNRKPRKVIPLDNLDDCPICLEPMYKDLYIFECKHTCHMKCGLTWVSRNQSCPLCRHVETKDNILKAIVKVMSY